MYKRVIDNECDLYVSYVIFVFLVLYFLYSTSYVLGRTKFQFLLLDIFIFYSCQSVGCFIFSIVLHVTKVEFNIIICCNT